MLDFLFYTASLLVTLGVLVTFHEWGHYYAARKLGVKVLRFSVGFGKPLYKRVAKNGVEFVVAGIPLGGYVKMLDERDSDVAEEDKPFAFNRQPIWKRNIIVAAGPVANFLLALIVFWFMFMLGVVEPKPILGSPVEGSIAEKAGLKANHEIVAIDDEPVSGWKSVSWALVERMGEQGTIELVTQDPITGSQQTHRMNIDQWQVNDRRPDIFKSLGIVPKRELDSLIGGMSDDGAAKAAGMRVGDRIVEMNDIPIKSFNDVAKFMQSVKSTEAIHVTVERNGVNQQLNIRPQQENGRFLIGVMPYQAVKIHEAGVYEGFVLAVDETWRVISLTVTMLKKLILGEVSTKSLGGPISIAEGAGSSVRGGLVYFLSFLGMISVNLGLINLLPVPVLDGGHLLFNTLEWIKGKPLSEKAQEFGMKVGILMVLGLMTIAIFNDIARL